MVSECQRIGSEAPEGPAEVRRGLAAGSREWRTCPWGAFLVGLALIPGLRAEPLLCTFVDRNDKPLGNVEARLTVVGSQDAADLPPLYRKSNKEGVVKFPELLPGEYILDVQLRGYVRASQRLTAGIDFRVRRTLIRRNEFERIERRARQDLDASEFLSAARGIESLLDFYPEDAVLHDTLARAYAGLDDEARALEEARIAARLDPENYGGADLRVRSMPLAQPWRAGAAGIRLGCRTGRIRVPEGDRARRPPCVRGPGSDIRPSWQGRGSAGCDRAGDGTGSGQSPAGRDPARSRGRGRGAVMHGVAIARGEG